MDLDILLGPVVSDGHMQKLVTVATWLDQNKFPCTFSMCDGIARLDVCQDPNGPTDWTWDTFRFYVLDTVICALAAHLDTLPGEQPNGAKG